MCGICGYINFDDSSDSSEIILSMVNTLKHRGPDDKGVELINKSDYQLAFGHSRLSIIDTSLLGHQPMLFDEFMIAFNGEIYNYKEIKVDLEKKGHRFISDSDTEVVLHAFKEWGKSCVDRFIGMFAIALFDKNTNILYLIRDRAGVKPLFYYYDEHVFIFGSELKSFHKHPLFNKELDYFAVGLFMKFGYIPTPYSIFLNTNKLKQASILEFNILNKSIKIEKYWDLKLFYSQPTIEISYDEAKSEVEKLMESAFNYRLVSDVPVGIFLSGGYDSASVAAILQKNRSQKLKTFTIGFEGGYNEAPKAKAIANHLGTDHTEYYFKFSEAQELIKDLPFYYDEPFDDNSALPTMLISKLARKEVTVALSGDGGDEIFGGYDKYTKLQSYVDKLNLLPKQCYPLLGKSLNILKKYSIEKQPRLQNKINVLSYVLSNGKKNMEENFLISAFGVDPNVFLRNSHLANLSNKYYSDFKFIRDFLSKELYFDYSMYMQDDVLVKVDRATMSASLEGREPLLDHRLIEFVARLPSDYKIKNGVKKRILKDIVHKYIPSELMNSTKVGFNIPMEEWLKTDLKNLIDYYLSVDFVNKVGVFKSEYIESIKNLYFTNKLDSNSQIWRLLQFYMWYEKWFEIRL